MADEKREYQRYLKSGTWKRVSQLARQRAGYRCEVCREVGPTQVHHHRYPKNRANDCETNLVVLCEVCHAKAHGHDWVFHVMGVLSQEALGEAKSHFYRRYRSVVDGIKVMEPCRWQEFAL